MKCNTACGGMKKAEQEFLFVYGTLRLQAGRAMGRWLARHADYVGSGTVRGRLYLVTDYPGCVASSDPQDCVRGEVYRLRYPAATLARLDEYEGYGPRFPTPNEFIRSRQHVRLASTAIIIAWIYLYNLPFDTLPRIDSGDFP